jgi:hypothetical protein
MNEEILGTSTDSLAPDAQVAAPSLDRHAGGT